MYIKCVHKIILTFESGIDDNCVRHYVTFLIFFAMD